MNAVKLSWFGDDLLKRVRAAQPRAITQTIDAAVAAARTDHPGWQSRTGTAEASITSLPAVTHGPATIGAIGFLARQGFFLDRGWQHHPAGDLTIERAANREFSKLVDRLRVAMKF